MIENLENPTDASSVETPVVGGNETTQFDVDKVDNIAQVREWGRSLENDLKAAKPAREFVESTFGTLDNAKLGASIYSGFAGDEFDPDAFYKQLEQLSPNRAKQLFEKYAASQATDLAKKEVEKLLGGKVSPEEVQLFKQFRENGYGLGDGEDIPEALKFNPDGTPRSEDEIKFFRDLQRRFKDSQEAQTAEKTAKEQQMRQEQEMAIQEQITEFANDRLNILNDEFKAYGLSDAEGDTAEDRAEKQFLRQFIINGVSGAYINDPTGSKDYASAVAHIRNGETLLARRYEARIESKLVEIMRSKALGKLFSSLTKELPKPEVKPEISTTGTSEITPSNQRQPIPSGNDIYKSLVERGLIKG